MKTVRKLQPQAPLTLEQAKALQGYETLYHRIETNSDGSAKRWRVNGKVKTWKTRPAEVRIPVKHGLYDYDYVTEKELDLVSLESGEE